MSYLDLKGRYLFLYCCLFHCRENAVNFARSMHVFTGGNPFFLLQFLRLAVADGVVSYDKETKKWGMDASLSVCCRNSLS